jgi:hypothetical protein
MAGLVPAIHVTPFSGTRRVSGRGTTWMTGTSPVITVLLSSFSPGKPPADWYGFKESIS